jgi:hypothetical protein
MLLDHTYARFKRSKGVKLNGIFERKFLLGKTRTVPDAGRWRVGVTAWV